MDRSSFLKRPLKSQRQDLASDARQGRGIVRGAREEPTRSERGRESPGRFAEVGHVEGATYVLPIGMSGRMVKDGEKDPRIVLSDLGSSPYGRGLRVKEDGRVAERPRVRLLSRRADRLDGFIRGGRAPRVMEPGGAQAGFSIELPPVAAQDPHRLRNRLHVRQAAGAQPRSDPSADLFRGQSAPWRTYGCTIEPCGMVVWAIRFHPLSSTPRPRCASAIRVNGPMTDSRPTLETPSMITPG